MDNWIKLEPGAMPDFDKPVLVCKAGDENSTTIAWLRRATRDATGWSYEWIEERAHRYISIGITHWQPKPTPPKP